MRHFSLTIVVAGVLVGATPAMPAQPDGQGAGGQRGGGQGRGFGAPVQGTVTAVAAAKLTIRTDAGDSYAVSVADTTRVMENRQAIKLTDIKPGDMVTAMGQVDTMAKTVAAMMVNATDAATVARAKENLGKTYITGRITAIDTDNLKLTVMRTDNQSQAIAVDEGTSFQRGTRGVAADVTAAGGLAMGGGFGGGRGFGGNRPGGGAAQAAPPAPESITLADIKVGDAVMATGTLKGGTFTVTKMGDSGQPGSGQGQGRRAGPGSAPGLAPASVSGDAGTPAGPPSQ